MPGRTIAIGDIHGCSRALDALIAAIGPAPVDEIVTLGDYVDRGPDTPGVLDRLIALGSRCRLVPLLGNHDELMLDALTGGDPLDWYGSGGLATLESYDRWRRFDAIPARHVDFLRGCRNYHETETHIFAHASYDPDLPMTDQSIAKLRWAKLRLARPARHHSGRIAVVGHTSQKSGEILNLGHLICIDTYCHGGGWLTALDAQSGRLWQVNRHGVPRRSPVTDRTA
jgi:serine/threonine protein phosphatase 1